MQPDEMTAIMKTKTESDKNSVHKSWEQTRLICFYMMIAMNGSEIKTKDGKTIKLESPADLFPFGWDEPKDEKPGNRLTREEFLEKAEQIKKLMNL